MMGLLSCLPTMSIKQALRISRKPMETRLNTSTVSPLGPGRFMSMLSRMLMRMESWLSYLGRLWWDGVINSASLMFPYCGDQPHWATLPTSTAVMDEKLSDDKLNSSPTDLASSPLHKSEKV